MPPSKMMLGIGTYGRGDTPAMPYTGFKGESGFVAYYEVGYTPFHFFFDIAMSRRAVFKSFARK